VPSTRLSVSRLRLMPALPKNARLRKVVRAVKIADGFATCPCGKKIRLQPDGPILKSGKREFLPVLVGVICPKCGAEVRLDSDELSQTSAVLRKF
jgi:hypothetical protein